MNNLYTIKNKIKTLYLITNNLGYLMEKLEIRTLKYQNQKI